MKNLVKVLCVAYFFIFLMFVGAITSAILTQWVISFAVLFPLSLIGMWAAHSVMMYADGTTTSKLIAFGLGAFNLASLGIWGIVKSIQLLAKRNEDD